jgi:hypothetical protein
MSANAPKVASRRYTGPWKFDRSATKRKSDAERRSYVRNNAVLARLPVHDDYMPLDASMEFDDR